MAAGLSGILGLLSSAAPHPGSLSQGLGGSSSCSHMTLFEDRGGDRKGVPPPPFKATSLKLCTALLTFHWPEFPSVATPRCEVGRGNVVFPLRVPGAEAQGRRERGLWPAAGVLCSSPGQVASCLGLNLCF